MNGRLANLIPEALGTSSGRQALATAMEPIIRSELERREFSSLLLKRHRLSDGERAIYPRTPSKEAAFCVSRKERAKVAAGYPYSNNEFVVPTLPAEGSREMTTRDIRDGGEQLLTDTAIEVARRIGDRLDKRTLRVLEAAAMAKGHRLALVPGCPHLTENVLRRGISQMQSRGVFAKYIVMRNGHFDGIRCSRAIERDVPDEERDKGVVATFDGISVLLTDKLLLTDGVFKNDVLNGRVLLVPDEEVGKLPGREPMVARFAPVRSPAVLRFSACCEVGHAVRRPSNLVVLTDVEVGRCECCRPCECRSCSCTGDDAAVAN